MDSSAQISKPYSANNLRVFFSLLVQVTHTLSLNLILLTSASNSNRCCSTLAESARPSIDPHCILGSKPGAECRIGSPLILSKFSDVNESYNLAPAFLSF